MENGTTDLNLSENMWMSNIFVVIDPRNADSNSLEELRSAICDLGATVVEVDAHRHVIEATLPASEVLTVVAMEGVSYVRNFFTYFVGYQPVKAG